MIRSGRGSVMTAGSFPNALSSSGGTERRCLIGETRVVYCILNHFHVNKETQRGRLYGEQQKTPSLILLF